MPRKLRRLAKLSAVEWLVLFQLVLSALIVMIAVRFLSLPRLINLLSQWAENRLVGRLPLFHSHFAEPQVTNLADIAAWVTHRQGRCLMRSLLLFWLFNARNQQ